MLEKIAEMPESDRVIAERLHAVIKANAPVLTSKLWYGMPAYARNGKVACFFQSAANSSRVRRSSRRGYAVLGFSDEGAMWPTSFALTELTADDEARIGALVKQAVS